jgi:sulfur-carrier protein adenylyltransferase/sulfurtransferase
MPNNFEKNRLSNDELNRYSRHLILENIGLEGQLKLKNSKVLVVGTGALGSPALLYLSAAGVGTIGIIDFDIVEESNLQRQIIHSTKSIGKSKISSAKMQINEINPNINVVDTEDRLSSRNALEIIKNFDVVVDGTDNFQTRYLINDACVFLNKPFIYGAISKFEGQTTVFNHKNSACYRCLFPNPPKAGLVQSCSEAGVLGVLPGIVGTIQATETIKLLLNIGENLNNRLLSFDALKMRFFEYKISKNENCAVCGKNPTIKELIDYEEFCGLKNLKDEIKIDELSVKELKKLILAKEDIEIIDITQKNIMNLEAISNSKKLEVNQILEDLNLLNSSKKVIIVCTIGLKSKELILKLKELSYKGEIYSLSGGLSAWNNSL